MRHLILAAALASLAAAAAAQAAPSASAGKTLAGETCAACHGPRGDRTADGDTPKLAGQKAGYLVRQLRDFRSGARPSETMFGFAEDLTDTQIADLAAWFAAQKRSPSKTGNTPAGDAALGARLFQARGRGNPPCAACHAPEDFQRPGMGGGMGGGMGRGMGGMGRGMGPMHTDPATTPVLYAQTAPYLLTQLNAFADGRRTGSVMGPIAARLTVPERAALAAYLSSHAAASR